METPRAAELLKAPVVRLAFDTNALFGVPRFITICRRIHQLSARQGNEISLYVSAAAHAEKLHDIKQRFQATYNYQNVLNSLSDLQVRILPFEERHAQGMGELLGRYYPSSKEWHEAKRKHYLLSLGLRTETETPGNGSQCSATLDWLIAAHVQEEECVLITNDRGPEFKGLERKMKIQILEQALDSLDAGSRV